MTIDEVFDWLIETNPNDGSTATRQLWTNMASYCYFINVVDFDRTYQDKLKNVLQRCDKYDIHIPDHNHRLVIDIANHIKMGDPLQKIKDHLYAEREAVAG